mmetsp:Transcript_74498/g.230228  ORF Transcript_74498/g.230228 Transcript_74498/m.230228 type:complete len:325 (+) Transcript_74498:70-1044(+)
MPAGPMLFGGLVLLGLAPATALRRRDEPVAAAALEGGGTFGADADSSTKFIFVTHHKTGTNLAQRLCNISALTLSDGAEQCHWCLKLMRLNDNGTITCPTDFASQHGTFRGSVGRFTMFSSLSARDLRRLRKWAPDYRIVHMTRDPVSMIVSDYQYNKRLYESGKFLWDMTVNKTAFGSSSSLEDALRNISYSLSHFVNDMCSLTEATKDDPHVLTMDLKDFQGEAFEPSTRQLFSFMHGAEHAKMAEMVEGASMWNSAKYPNLRTFHVFFSGNNKTPAIETKVQEMFKAGDPMVTAAASCAGAAAAVPWASKVSHTGSARRMA